MCLLVNASAKDSRCKYIREEVSKMTSEQSSSLSESIKSLTIVSVTAIMAIMICCLASLGCNTKITIEKEKIEVTTNNSNLR